MLVLEDLHWSDRSTRDLLAFLVRNLRAERLLLVATYRSDELYRGHPLRPLLAEIDRGRRLARLEVRPFTRAEVAEQLEGILGVRPRARARGFGVRALAGQRVLRGGARDDRGVSCRRC